MHRLLIAAAAASGLLTMSYALTAAHAAPLSPVTAAAQPNVVTPVAQGFRGGGMGMGGMGSRGMGIGRPGIGGAGRFAYRGGTATPRMYRGTGHGYGQGHNHHHRRFYYAAPFVGYGSSGCGWLYRRAETTGSRYWWSRYEACLDENS